MKTLTFLTAFVFSVLMFSSTSVAEWKWVDKSVEGNTFYVDFERIRKHGGYVYFWELIDYLEPITGWYLSVKVYNQGDCDLMRYKNLTKFYFTEPMGSGTLKVRELTNFQKQWIYPPPDSTGEIILRLVCAYAN